MQKIYSFIKSYPLTNILKRYVTVNSYMFALFIFTAIYFYFFPDIDLKISSLFYSSDSGFFLRSNPLSQITFYGVNYTAITLICLFTFYIIFSTIFNKQIFGIKRKSIIFLLLAMALAPGLVVNEILKDNIGRARPDVVIEFGGDKLFSPPFADSNECTENCSFVSGHSSFGFYLMAFGFLATGLRRKFLMLGGFFIGCLVGLMRVADGRHFFTDILFSFFFVYLTIALLYQLMYYKQNNNINHTI